MTEEDAKTKWCPFARYTSPDDTGSANRWNGYTFHDPNGAVTACIASKCMAWRWHVKSEIDKFLVSTDDGAPDPSGYCGLAGRPAVPSPQPVSKFILIWLSKLGKAVSSNLRIR